MPCPAAQHPGRRTVEALEDVRAHTLQAAAARLSRARSPMPPPARAADAHECREIPSLGRIGAVHVPYRGTPEALRRHHERRDRHLLPPIVAALPMIKQGRVVALANGSPRRSSVLPELATTEEQGFADGGYTSGSACSRLRARAAHGIDRLNAEARRALEAPEVKEDRLRRSAPTRRPPPAGARVEEVQQGDTGQLGAGEEGRHPAADIAVAARGRALVSLQTRFCCPRGDHPVLIAQSSGRSAG